MDLEIGQDGDRLLLPVRVQPKASRTALIGVVEGELKIAVKAPPVDGAANKELLRFLGRKLLSVAPGRLEIVRGASGRSKLVAVPGMDRQELLGRLGLV